MDPFSIPWPDPPQDEADVSAMLQEVLMELRSVNEHLERLLIPDTGPSSSGG